MTKSLEDLVRRRSGNRCEYCRHPLPPFHFEHIIAKKHGGPTSAENLAIACIRCNLHKGSNLCGIDPATGTVVRLFNPRTDAWTDHFRWQRAILVGRTPTGRATIAVLEINHLVRVQTREQFLAEGISL
jgi:5-methylcytosine-specific restriction endonuclease McrA